MYEKKLSNMDTRRYNRNMTFRYIIKHKNCSRPSIAAALNLSQPTVMALIGELVEKKLIVENGSLESTGGRKAKAINAVFDFQYAIGIEISDVYLNFVLTDLSEKIIYHTRYDIIFENTDAYFLEISSLLDRFIVDAGIPKEKILGLGIALPGTIDNVEKKISISHDLKLKEVPFSAIKKYFSYPCQFINNTFSAAFAESLLLHDSKPFYYFSLSNVNGGVYVDANSLKFQNPNNLYSYMDFIDDIGCRGGEIGHVTLYPGGRDCYCGRRGCFDAYCSVPRLISDTPASSLSDFMRLRKKDTHISAIWDKYLDDLAIMINNIHILFNVDIILGGRIGGYIEPYLEDLCEKLTRQSCNKEPIDYIRICRQQIKASALGAANIIMEQYIDQI